MFPLPSLGLLSLSLTRAVTLRLLPRALGSGEDADTEQEGPLCRTSDRPVPTAPGTRAQHIETIGYYRFCTIAAS